MKAKVISKQGQLTPNGRERILQIRSGEKGTGRQIGNSVLYWPWSAISCKKADEIIAEIARRNNVELVFEEM